MDNDTHKGSGEVILVVEDQHDLLHAIAKVLESFDYLVLTASNGPEAIRLLEADGHIDVLLTDIVMPGGVGGFELANRARELKPSIAVVFMSGYHALDGDAAANADAPMVPKPCRPAQLAQTLRDVLSS